MASIQSPRSGWYDSSLENGNLQPGQTTQQSEGSGMMTSEEIQHKILAILQARGKTPILELKFAVFGRPRVNLDQLIQFDWELEQLWHDKQVVIVDSNVADLASGPDDPRFASNRVYW
jgi:hypothetical protein